MGSRGYQRGMLSAQETFEHYEGRSRQTSPAGWNDRAAPVAPVRSTSYAPESGFRRETTTKTVLYEPAARPTTSSYQLTQNQPPYPHLAPYSNAQLACEYRTPPSEVSPSLRTMTIYPPQQKKKLPIRMIVCIAISVPIFIIVCLLVAVQLQEVGIL